MRTPTSRSLHGRPAAAAAALTDTALGAAIRDRRMRRGLRQDALAARAGIDRRVLSRLERGERACRVAELDAIASALGVSLLTLIGDVQQRTTGTETAA